MTIEPSVTPTPSVATPAAPTDRIVVEVVDGIAHATLHRPDKLNALDMPMLRALVSTPKRIAADRSVRAVILRGAGGAFCSGLDFGSLPGPAGMARAAFKLPVQKTNLFQQACWSWRELPVPVLAVTEGHCYGGGLQLALAADFRFSTPDCRFSIMEARWGLIPDMTGTVTLRELLPIDVAKRLAMTGEIFDGVRAAELGLVTEVADDPLAAAQGLARQIVERSPDAVAATKKLFNANWSAVSARSALWNELVAQVKLMTGENHRIARRVGRDRETPVWKPRR